MMAFLIGGKAIGSLQWADRRASDRSTRNQPVQDVVNDKLMATGGDVATSVEEAIVTRRSVRRFLPTSVPREIVEHILTVASRAPSGTNMQPWRLYVLSGTAKQALSAAIIDADRTRADRYSAEYQYYPREFPEPYRSRRRKVGWDLYGLLGIKKGDTERMRAQHARNYEFFDAPVGMIFTIDRVLEIGSWLDYGMFLENVMLAARGMGLHTCPQASFIQYHAIIKDHLRIGEDEIVVCGMSLGYADHEAPENQLITEREPVASFTRFIDS